MNKKNEIIFDKTHFNNKYKFLMTTPWKGIFYDILTIKTRSAFGGSMSQTGQNTWGLQVREYF